MWTRCLRVARGRVSGCRAVHGGRGVGRALQAIDQWESVFGAYLTLCDPTGDTDCKTNPADTEEQNDGLLSGWPVAVKDNFTMRGHACSAGSAMLERWEPSYDATVVQLLQRAGAHIVGKTQLDEFAMGSFTVRTPLAASPTNPHPFMPVPEWDQDEGTDTDSTQPSPAAPSPPDVSEAISSPPVRISVGGSSGGSACAVRYGGARVAVGTDTGGSVRLPAAYTGLVGLKPSYGRVSRHGVVAYGSSLDTVGVLATGVPDAYQTLRALSYPDTHDATLLWTDPLPAWSPLPDSHVLRIGVPQELWTLQDTCPAVRGVWAAVLSRLEQQRHKLSVELVAVEMASLTQALPAYYMISTAEAASNLACYDGIRYGGMASQDPEQDLPDPATVRSQLFGDEVVKRILAGCHITSHEHTADYIDRAYQLRGRVCRETRETLQSVDVLLYPTAASTAPFIADGLEWGRAQAFWLPGQDAEAVPEGATEAHEDQQAGWDSVEYATDVFTVLANMTGAPAVSIPCGEARVRVPNSDATVDLPIGLQVMGAMGDDVRVCQAAQAILTSLRE